MTTYTAKIGSSFDNRVIGWFETWQEASEFCNKRFAETGESAWVSQEEPRPLPIKTFDAPACN